MSIHFAIAINPNTKMGISGIIKLEMAFANLILPKKYEKLPKWEMAFSAVLPHCFDWDQLDWAGEFIFQTD